MSLPTPTQADQDYFTAFIAGLTEDEQEGVTRARTTRNENDLEPEYGDIPNPAYVSPEETPNEPVTINGPTGRMIDQIDDDWMYLFFVMKRACASYAVHRSA